MPRNEELDARLATIETHVMSQDRAAPGLLMRVDRLELFVKLLIALTGLGVLWKALDVIGQVLARVLVQ